MARERPAGIPAADDRWQRMWSHREQLLKVARRRSMSLEDAEDAVHEAMLRAAERPDLDEERLGAWLTTVTVRLCVDRYRQVNRETAVRARPPLHSPGPVPVEEAVCDRAEARWLAVRSGELPARQAEALRLKSEDLDVGQVAVRMGLSYRTVESLLARARRTLRDSLAGTLGLALFLIGRGRLRGTGKAVAVASTAVSLTVAGFVLPYALGEGRATDTPPPRPAVSDSARALRTDGTDRLRTPESGRPPPSASTAPGPAATTKTPDGSLVPLSVPPLPDVSVPPVPDVPGLPSAPLPKLPTAPAVPRAPDLPVHPPLPTVPSVPNAPAVPSVSLPPVPDTPSTRLP
ncbi:RNA polymerase sigma factor [Streptomyces sp. V3I7]|uniref:RNA polymerase sigma factor n=1 Tax=Streptomyces sp. V3I7 TaxID=3042278 RepID=UPI00278AF397|nr:sigma-70 family RNA polymerase sigma factor [Streptomyces sp. V3I7]MDQ0993781.1 RNA polymerase sigma factor (sigma-70 family) [Streptomyces sp. V3I7]